MNPVLQTQRALDAAQRAHNDTVAYYNGASTIVNYLARTANPAYLAVAPLLEPLKEARDTAAAAAQVALDAYRVAKLAPAAAVVGVADVAAAIDKQNANLAQMGRIAA